jgi:hypothetical protein
MDLNRWSAFGMTPSHPPIKDLFAVVDQLPVEQKAELVRHVLGSSELNVVLGTHQLEDIDRMNRAELSDLLAAIANRIRNE